MISHSSLTNSSRVEVPITDYLKDYAPDLEEYKAVYILPM